MAESKSVGNPTVSVIIATYNYSSVLRYAIATVLWQTFQEFELIVVGDACTDDSEEVVRSFHDPRVRWLNLPENSGSKSLPQNAGIAGARGRFIAYLAHDDLWHPRHLETVVAAIERNKADLVYSVAVYVPPPGETLRHVSGIFPEGQFRTGYALVHSTVIHPVSLIYELGDWPDYRKLQMASDHFFWTRAAEAGKRFVGVPKLTVWKFNASSRPGCYRDRRCDEQARYFVLLRDDPELAEKELIAVASSAMRDGLEPLKTQKIGRDAPPGSFVHSLRQIRGLEEIEPMNPLPLSGEEGLLQIELAANPTLVLRRGQHFELELRIRNDSGFTLTSHPPYPVRFAYHWLHPGGSIAVWDGERTGLVPPLDAHATRHYFATIRAPATVGQFQLQPALVQEEVRWFEVASPESILTFEVR